MGEPEIAAFFTHLATRQNISASTQNQALYAIPMFSIAADTAYAAHWMP